MEEKDKTIAVLREMIRLKDQTINKLMEENLLRERKKLPEKELLTKFYNYMWEKHPKMPDAILDHDRVEDSVKGFLGIDGK